MTRVLGFSTILVALVLAIYGLIAAVVGARRGRDDLVRSAEMAVYANFVLLTVSNLAMVYALVGNDFSISYVARVGSRATPFLFSVASLWSSLEGSLLFWGWVLATFTAGAVYLTSGKLEELKAYATATMLAVGCFFYILLIGPANPWHAVWPVPPDGPGPNPLLQNHWLMAVHPPLLYFGYVGMTVPFAFAIGALLSGRLDDAWLRATRRWTIAAWGFLTIGIISGMWWAYEVLGWGGYWAWDPVENASLLPWLTATAFLHSAMVQERRGMMRVWNLGLIIATFILTVLGTFLTRSGVLLSVHAFSEGPIGIYFLVFIAVCLLVSLTLLAGRAAELRTAGRIEALLSRETFFLLNNVILVVLTFTVLLGTLFPLIVEMLQGSRVSVGPPFFNRMTVPFIAALLLMLGVAPTLRWRGAQKEKLLPSLTVPVPLAILGGTIAVVAGVRSVLGVLVFAFAALAAATHVQAYLAGARARRAAHGESLPQALGSMLRSNPRRFGGYLTHLGVVLMVTGIAASSLQTQEIETTLRPGQALGIGSYVLRLDELWGRQDPQRFVVAADMTVFKGDRQIAVLSPRQNFYQRMDPLTTPAVRSRPHEDLYVSLLAFEQDGSSATLHVLVEPLVFWIWFGGCVVALGAFVAIWPWKRVRIRRKVQES